MPNNPLDLLQIKIENAKAQLPEEAVEAINSVPWKITILEMRTRRGYSFEQLGDLELETELLLSGLLNPADYPKELANRMKITKVQADDLVKEMNELVFKRIREEFIKNTEKKKIVTEIHPQNVPKKEIKKEDIQIPTTTDIEVGKPEITPPAGILAQKLSGSFQIPVVKTEYGLPNVSKNSSTSTEPISSKIDPYRMTPE